MSNTRGHLGCTAIALACTVLLTPAPPAAADQRDAARHVNWTGRALSNLIEHYGCETGVPDGVRKSQRSMTRFEAAALLHACLEDVTEVNDDLEARRDELEASQFSTTTRLRGEASVMLNGSPDFNSPRRKTDGSRPASPNQTSVNNDLRLILDTSVTGSDLLRIRLRSGNFSRLPFREGVFTLDRSSGSEDRIRIDRFFYRFSASDDLQVTVGALVRNNDILSFFPSSYRSEVLDYFSLAGASGTYNKATGAGIGLSWRQPQEATSASLTLDASIVANKGFADSSIGVDNRESGLNALAQLGYSDTNWGLALSYRYGSQNSRLADANFNATVPAGAYTNSLAIAGYWSPSQSSWTPSISLGYGYNWTISALDDSQSWMAGLQWDDVIWAGNTIGFAMGQPPFTGSANNGMLYELFCRVRLSDRITLTPALFYGSSVATNGGNDAWGGMLQTTFRF
ncbi:MAG: iron uptake porin [Prochlorococcaceae cyanobacterium]